MKKLVMLSAFALSSQLYAGGTIGGSTGLTQQDFLLGNIADFAFDGLPKIEVESDLYRRTAARLSLSNAEAIPLNIDGEQIEVRKIRDRIIDKGLSKEIVPAQ